MAQVDLHINTESKEFVVKIDGKQIENVQDFYASYFTPCGVEEEAHVTVEFSVREEDGDVTKITRFLVYASDKGRKAVNDGAVESRRVLGFVEKEELTKAQQDIIKANLV